MHATSCAHGIRIELIGVSMQTAQEMEESTVSRPALVPDVSRSSRLSARVSASVRAPPPKTSAQLSAQHVPCWLKIVVSMRRRRRQRRMAPTAASVADDSIGQPHALREKGTHGLRTHESAWHVSHRAHAAHEDGG